MQVAPVPLPEPPPCSLRGGVLGWTSTGQPVSVLTDDVPDLLPILSPLISDGFPAWAPLNCPPHLSAASGRTPASVAVSPMNVVSPGPVPEEWPVSFPFIPREVFFFLIFAPKWQLGQCWGMKLALGWRGPSPASPGLNSVSVREKTIFSLKQ